MDAVKQSQEVDIYRDTPVRLLGYANEVGEAFRALISSNAVKASYGVAAIYCIADTVDKTQKAAKESREEAGQKTKKLVITAADTLIWQALASVIIPGFTINRVCALSLKLLQRHSKQPIVRQKWITTFVGLGCIPFIVKPIDHGVDFAMDKTLRKAY
jgi:fission process protein 1